MSENYTAKHRANGPVRTEPRVQPIGKHIGEYQPEDRMHERLGADAFDDLEAEMLSRKSSPLGRLLWETCVAPKLVTR